MNQHFTPTTSRIEMLDVLRGFAIFGILMVNMQIFYQPISRILIGYMGSESVTELIGELFIKIFFEGKFYVLFSMLFGYGFWLFINRPSPDGSSILPTYRLRVLFLFLFGAAHIVLLWAGDILVFYALFGFLLILFRKVSDRGLIKWAIWVGLIPTILMLFFSLMFALASLHPESKSAFEASMQTNFKATLALFEKSGEAYTNGNFRELVGARLMEYAAMLPGILFFYPVVLSMFLVGVWAARRNLIKNFSAHLTFFRKALIWGLATGVPISVFYAYAYTQSPAGQPGIWGLASTSMHTIGGIMLSLAYVSSIILLSAKGKMLWFNKMLAPVGRMALTNYLLHSIICTIIFLPYGFGMFGKISSWQGIALAFVIFLLQIPFSKFWLKHFNYGPFEWLWRSLTYLKIQPFKKQ